MTARRRGEWSFPPGTVLLLGVVAEHNDNVAQRLLEELTAWVMTHPSMPLVPTHIHDDCCNYSYLQSAMHVEARWIIV
jgi:hypothetical protein